MKVAPAPTLLATDAEAGRDAIAFTTTSGAPFAGITRTFPSVAAAAEENADSRVYAGIHFRRARPSRSSSPVLNHSELL